MLKGLALRQTFVLLNALLIIALGGIGAMATKEFLAKPINPGSVSSPTSGRAPADASARELLARADYDLILKKGLFGSAGQYDPGAKPAPKKTKPAPPPPEPETSEETKLPLKLNGTTFSGKNNPTDNAIIEVRQGAAKTKTFFLGQEILPNVFLIEIRRKEVVLDNQRNHRNEVLKITRKEAPGSKPRIVTARNPAIRSAAAARPRMITLDRADITKRIEEEYARIASTLDIRVVKDEGGRTKGVTVDGIEDIAIAKELGFKNGDILTSINNEPVDSREKGAEIVRKYRNASIFRIGILRDGQPQYINYRVR